MLIKKQIVNELNRHKVFEAKQVGTLYHVCTIDSLANYIVPKDTLSGSGKYKNRMLDNRTDIVSFTRNKNYVVSTSSTRNCPILFRLVIDGDKISENHKVKPYNDLAFNSITGKRTSFNSKELEQEEIVIGDIYPLSKFIQRVEYCVNDNLFDCVIRELQEIIKDINTIFPYISRFNLSYNKNLKVMSEGLPPFHSLLDCRDFTFDYLNLCKLNISNDSLNTLLSKFDKFTNHKIYNGFISILFPSMAEKAIPYMPIFYKNGIDLDTIIGDCSLLFPDDIGLLNYCFMYYTGSKDILKPYMEKKKINESKQVGTLYHVCNAEAIAKYIAPTDTLSASGKFTNYLKGGKTFISFTRNKHFTVNVESTQQLFLFKFVVNGDLLSENYTVTPYNDFAFDTMGRKLYVRNVPTKTEFEEIVNGPIKSFSRYIEKILFTYNIKRFLIDYDFDLSIINTLREDLQACKSYVNRNHIEYSPEFCKISDEGNRLVLNKYPISFNEVVHLMDILCSIREGSAEYIKDYLKWFNTDVFCVRDFLLGNLSYNMIQKNIPLEYYKQLLIKDSYSWDNNKIRELIEKYPLEIDSTNKHTARGSFLTAIAFLEDQELECCLTSREVMGNNIEKIPQSKIKEFIQNCVKADTDSSFTLYNQLFSSLFKGLLNYDRIIKDTKNINSSMFSEEFNSLRGYDLIRKLEKENILSKDSIISFLMEKNIAENKE